MYKKDEFSSVAVFMHTWGFIRNPKWFLVKCNDIITLGQESTAQYCVKYIDYLNDKIQLSPMNNSRKVYGVREICDIPFMKIVKSFTPATASDSDQIELF